MKKFPVYEQLKNLNSSVTELITTLYLSTNVSSDEKNLLLTNKIDISNSWKSNETYIQRLSPGLLKYNNSNSPLFTISSNDIILKYFNSEKIQYEDLKNNTSIFFQYFPFKTINVKDNNPNKSIMFESIHLQKSNDKPTVPDSEQLEQIFKLLDISQNLNNMLSMVNNVNNKIIELDSSRNNLQNIQSISSENSELTIDSIMNKIKQTKASHEIVFKPNLNKPSN